MIDCGGLPWLIALAVLSLPTSGNPADSPSGGNDLLRVQQFLRSYYLKNKDTPDPSVRVAIAFADLKGDGPSDAIVYVSGSGYCGSGGCTTLVLVPAGASYRVAMDEPITFPPIRLLRSSTGGWRDISFVRKGDLRGEYFEYDEVVRSFNGWLYRDERQVHLRRPSPLPGKTLIAEDNAGTRLNP